MRKKLLDELLTKARKRQDKKRPRMRVHSRSLLVKNPRAGKKLAAKK